MVDKNSDFFRITDNFTKTATILSIPILKSTLDFKPKVTIAIPTYKRVNLLKETLESAINQREYENYDIIVVDNDSERGCETEKLMLSFTNKRISYYKNSENIGMAGNWNRLFELAEGEYVVMLHDDDLILSSFLSECMYYVNKEPDLGIIKPIMETFSDSVTQSQMEYFEKDSINFKGCKLIKLRRIFDIDNYLGYILGAPTGCLLNKQAVLKTGGFNDQFFPSFDYYFAVMFSSHYKVYILKKRLTLYRWGVNETLKISVLRRFIFDAYYLRKSIFEKYRLPKYFMNKYLIYSVMNDILTWKKINANFEFDLSDLNLKRDSYPKLYIISTFVKIYMRAVKTIKYRAI